MDGLSLGIERVKRTCLELCPIDLRGSVRFVGPRKRRYSTRLTVENLDGVDMALLCKRLEPAVVYVRHTSAAEVAVSSRIDVYVPVGITVHLFLAYRIMYALACAAAGLGAFIVFKRSA
jgi:hypothetical protein